MPLSRRLSFCIPRDVFGLVVDDCLAAYIHRPLEHVQKRALRFHGIDQALQIFFAGGAFDPGLVLNFMKPRRDVLSAPNPSNP